MSAHTAAWRAALARLIGTDYPRRSAAYRAQCYTWAIARRLSGLPVLPGGCVTTTDAVQSSVYQFHALAPCPAVPFTHYRTRRAPGVIVLRREVAALVRAERALLADTRGSAGNPARS